MAETKYGKYIIREPIKKMEVHPEVVAPMVSIKGQELGGVDFSGGWACISEPFLMIKDAHAHDFDQFLCFIGTNAMNMREFDAEIELSLGEEGEKHILNATTFVYVPKGLLHGPLDFKRIGKPVMFCDLYLAPDYSRKT